jgi:hypothetical protein
MKRHREEAEGEQRRQQRSRLDDETLRYYAEIDKHFKELQEDEERQLLANNVISDMQGKETEIVPDAACSRVLEALLPYTSNDVLDLFVRGCIQGENLGQICTR